MWGVGGHLFLIMHEAQHLERSTFLCDKDEGLTSTSFSLDENIKNFVNFFLKILLYELALSKLDILVMVVVTFFVSYPVFCL
jgi:hypothetical protein